jgi:AAA15 family ATPase/GTPase
MKKRNELSERNKKLWHLYKQLLFDVSYLKNDLLFMTLMNLIFLTLGISAFEFQEIFIASLSFGVFSFICGVTVMWYIAISRYSKIVKKE